MNRVLRPVLAWAAALGGVAAMVLVIVWWQDTHPSVAQNYAAKFTVDHYRLSKTTVTGTGTVVNAYVGPPLADDAARRASVSAPGIEWLPTEDGLAYVHATYASAIGQAESFAFTRIGQPDHDCGAFLLGTSGRAIMTGTRGGAGEVWGLTPEEVAALVARTKEVLLIAVTCAS